MKNVLYEGIYIPHKVIDAPSKHEAQDNMFGWKQEKLPAEDWIKKLESGQTIQPSKFKPKESGKYTHARKYWEKTHFVCADGDHISNVEFYEEDVLDANGNIIFKKGDDKNPEGLNPWTEQGQLSNIFPELVNQAYAVGESVSSMLSEPLHRRFRIIFVFDKPITSEEHYHSILLTLADKFPIIAKIARSPAQPVFGNGRDGFNFYICGNILKLDEFPIPQPKIDQPKENGKNQFTQTPNNRVNETLEEFLIRHHISYQMTEPGKFYVECPYKTSHTGEKQGPTDSYVFDKDNRWGFYCSHAHCSKRRTWQAFKDGHGIKTYKEKTEPIRIPYPEPEIEQSEEDPMTVQFPEELFYGVFDTYRKSVEGRTPIPNSFLFATLKQIISASLGRRIHVKSQLPIYPNTYTALIGKSADGHKGVAMTVAEQLLSKADPNVVILTKPSTEEGLLDLFTIPELRTGENEEGEYEYYTGGIAELLPHERVDSIVANIDSHESIRIIGAFEELSSVLNRSKKATFSGIPELFMQLYDARKEILIPNKGEKARADYPTYTMVAASAFELIEQSLAQYFITAGFTNRIEWYLGDEKEPIFIYKEADPDLWTECINDIEKIRESYVPGQSFTLTDEAYNLGDKWNKEFVAQLKNIDNILISGSIKRMKIMLIKNALIFAAMEHRKDHQIHTEDIIKAIYLSQYNCTVVEKLFGSFASSEHQRVCNRIIEILKKSPMLSAKQLQNQMKWADIKDIDLAIDLMIKIEIIKAIKPKRTVLYFVPKDSDDE